MSLHGERVDKALTATAKSAAVAGRKFYRFESTSKPKDAVLVGTSGGYADGVSRTLTDGTGEEFELALEGMLIVDAAAAVIAIDTFIMSNASGDAITYVAAAGNKALGIARSAATGGAGEQIIAHVFDTPMSATTVLA